MHPAAAGDAAVAGSLAPLPIPMSSINTVPRHALNGVKACFASDNCDAFLEIEKYPPNKPGGIAREYPYFPDIPLERGGDRTFGNLV